MSEIISPYEINQKLLPVRMQCEVEITLKGLLAIVQLKQTFTNTSNEVIEAIHSIPVPIESTLTDFKVRKNNQLWSGKVLPKHQADQQYEEAIDEGNGVFQLKRSKEDMLTVFLGNLLSKETLSIEMSLVFSIQFLAGQGQLYFPLLIGERYGQSNLLPETDPEHNFLAEYPVTVNLVTGYLSNQFLVQSPSHPLHKVSNGVYSASGLLDRDLKILFEPAQEMEPCFEVMPYGDDQLFGLVSMITPTQPQDNIEPRDILFVLDCSSSMDGSPIQQLRESVYVMLGEMRPQDRFNIYLYGNTVQPMFEQMQTATARNLTRAKQMVRRTVKADLGGTRTVGAMLMALMNYQKTRAADVVLITDGEIWLSRDNVEMKLLKAYANQHNIRFFTIGVGHVSTEDTVKYLAEISNGSYVLTNPHEDIRFQMQAHFKRLYQSPVNIHLKTKTLWHQLPSIFQGDALLMPMVFKTTPDQNERLPQVDFEIQIDQTNETYNLESKHIESRQVIQWIAQQQYSSIPENQKTYYAISYQLLTDQTAYYIEMERAETEKSDELPTLVKVPQMNSYGRHDSASSLDLGIRFSLRQLTAEDKDNDKVKQSLDMPNFLDGNQDDEANQLLIKQQNQMKQLKQYLESVLSVSIDGASNIDIEYCQIKSLKTPEELINWLRLAELSSNGAEILMQIIEILRQQKGWDQVVEAVLKMDK